MSWNHRATPATRAAGGYPVPWRHLATIAGAALAGLSFVAIAMDVADRPVSFDGAMNLEVALNLARGDGYVRDYGAERPFPAEIQTNLPFLLPAGLLMNLLGPSLLSAQLAGLLYLAGVAALCLRLLPPGGLAPVSAVLAVLATPLLLASGVNGYGEIPGLFWWLLGTLLVYRNRPATMISGAACMALACLTKTVMLLPAACTFAVWGLDRLARDRMRVRRSLGPGLLLIAGFALPLAAFEAYRFASLGSWDAYQAWWQYQGEQIFRQAGVTGTGDAPRPLPVKIAEHFRILSSHLGLPAPLAAVWLCAPALAAVASPLERDRNRRLVLLALVLTAGAYFLWWLAMTPTEKTWHRRILNGIVLVQILWIWTAALAWRSVPSDRSRIPLGVATALLAVWIGTGLWRNTIDRPGIARVEAYRTMIDSVRALPEDALLLTEGWYSAPGLALYSGRKFTDANRIPLARLREHDRVFAIRDAPAIAQGALREVMALYPAQRIATGAGVEIWELDSFHPQPWLSAPDPAAALRARVEPRAQAYPWMAGVSPDHWARTRAELYLSAPFPPLAVELAVYTPPRAYLYGESIGFRVRMDGCPVGSVRRPLGRLQTFRLPIPDGCRVSANAPVHLVISTDNVLDLPFPEDPRQLSYVLVSVALLGSGNGPLAGNGS